MRQAYAHLEPTASYYSEIESQIKRLVENWNNTHNSKCDFRTIAEDFKRIFKYHKWISIDDIQPAIDLGLMGQFGENKGLNSETIFKWFTGLQKMKSKNELKTHSAYKSEFTIISKDQRAQNRKELISVFMGFLTEYQKSKTLNPSMNQYIPIFFKWFKKLGYIQIDESKENEMREHETKALRDLRTILSRKPGKKTETLKSIFLESFKLAAENNYPIEEQLNKMKI